MHVCHMQQTISDDQNKHLIKIFNLNSVELDSLTIYNTTFHNIFITQYQYITSLNDTLTHTCYFVKKIGLIKYISQKNSKDTTWNLINYHAIQQVWVMKTLTPKPTLISCFSGSCQIRYPFDTRFSLLNFVSNGYRMGRELNRDLNPACP